MKTVLLLGAGRSATSLIRYLLKTGNLHGWRLMVCDTNQELAASKIEGAENAMAVSLDIHDEAKTAELIGEADLVISMLPARFHIVPARICAELGKSMVTASYVTDEIKALSSKFEENGALLLMELGLDPGIDHMSGMQILDQIKAKGYQLTAFETFTGGLIAPSLDDNPWQYKFTWNPRNVVLAGQGHVQFIQEGKFKYIPYHRLFRRFEVIHIPEHGYFEGYANRDSLKYLDVYGLRGIRTLYRGTLRRPGFCKAWNAFVQLGATDDNYLMEGVDKMTHREFINSFLYYNPHDSVELKLAHYMNFEIEGEEMYKLRWSGIFDDTPVGLEQGTPAQILEHILKKRWGLQPDDKDMIVMWHKFNFFDGEKDREIQSHMVMLGEDANQTAMALTVGLPMGIAAKLILTGKIDTKGVKIPIEKDIYQPILEELVGNGISFVEREVEVSPV